MASSVATIEGQRRLKRLRSGAHGCPKPYAVGLGFGVGCVEDFEPEPHDLPLDAILNNHRVVWPV